MPPLLNPQSNFSNRGKILWIACDSFNVPSNTNPGEVILETVETPNLDAICRFSATGLMANGDADWFDRPERFAELTRLRSLAITNCSDRCALEQTFEFDRYETVRGLDDFSKVLEKHWDAFHFFYLHLDGGGQVASEGSDAGIGERIEMVDAWLPGLLDQFQPEVFALSGDLEAMVSVDDAILAMIHSSRVQAHTCEGLSREGCRNGKLGNAIGLRQWILLLMAHSSRPESYRAALELYSR